MISESERHTIFGGTFMEMKKINIMWSISLIVIGIATIILAGSNLMGVDLPDIAVRICGITDLAALPVLAFTTVKKLKGK